MGIKCVVSATRESIRYYAGYSLETIPLPEYIAKTGKDLTDHQEKNHGCRRMIASENALEERAIRKRWRNHGINCR